MPASTSHATELLDLIRSVPTDTTAGDHLARVAERFEARPELTQTPVRVGIPRGFRQHFNRALTLKDRKRICHHIAGPWSDYEIFNGLALLEVQGHRCCVQPFDDHSGTTTISGHPVLVAEPGGSRFPVSFAVEVCVELSRRLACPVVYNRRPWYYPEDASAFRFSCWFSLAPTPPAMLVEPSRNRVVDAAPSSSCRHATRPAIASPRAAGAFEQGVALAV